MKCENYTYLQGQVEESLEECSSVTPQLPQSKSNHTAKKCSGQGSETESCQSFLSLETSGNSMEDLGEEQLTFFVEDSPAKTSALRVKEQELPESVRDFGKSMRDSLEKFGLNLSLPKTHHCFELGGLELSSKTWPKWGMMQDGECWELGTLVRPTNETECGSWRTPAAQEPGINVERLETKSGEPVGSMCRHYDKQTGRMAQIGLTQQVMAKATWPTPCRRDYKGTNAPEGLTRKDGKSRLDQLPNAVAYGGTQTQQKWMTPQARDWKGPSGRAYKGEAKDLPSQTQQKWLWPTPTTQPQKGGTKGLYGGSGHQRKMKQAGHHSMLTGQLNPSWVEWLMGWPIGWTDLKPLETDKFRNVQQWHSEFFRKD